MDKIIRPRDRPRYQQQRHGLVGSRRQRKLPSILEVPQTLASKQPRHQGDLRLGHLSLANDEEFPDDLAQPDWVKAKEKRILRGQFAREHGTMVPDRLITSAKSWLSNPHVDPSSRRCLPWQSEIEEKQKDVGSRCDPRLSRASPSFLPRLGKFRQDRRAGEIVVTVPASFDEVARNLTSEAAEAAGLNRCRPARGTPRRVLCLDHPDREANGAARSARAMSSWSAMSVAEPPTSACSRSRRWTEISRSNGSVSGSTFSSAATTWTWPSLSPCRPSWPKRRPRSIPGRCSP